MYSSQEKRYFLHNAMALYKKSMLMEFPFDEELVGKEDRYWANEIIDMGLIIGFGAIFPINEKVRFSIEIRDNFGLYDIWGSEGNSEMKTKSTNLLISRQSFPSSNLTNNLRLQFIRQFIVVLVNN